MGQGGQLDARAVAADTRHDVRVPLATSFLAFGWFAIALSVIAWSGARHGLGPTWTWAVLVAVAIAVQHRDVLVAPREAAFDGGLAVAVASVLVLGSHPAGPMSVGLLAGLLFVPQLRARSWTRLAANAGDFSLSTLAAWAALAASPIATDGIVETLVAAAVAGVAYWVANDGLGLALCAARDRGFTAADARRIVAEDARLLPLALIGGLAALAYESLGWWSGALVLAITPSLVEALVVGRRRRHRKRRRVPDEDALVAGAATAIARSLTLEETPEMVHEVLSAAEAVVDRRVR